MTFQIKLIFKIFIIILINRTYCEENINGSVTSANTVESSLAVKSTEATPPTVKATTEVVTIIEVTPSVKSTTEVVKIAEIAPTVNSTMESVKKTEVKPSVKSTTESVNITETTKPTVDAVENTTKIVNIPENVTESTVNRSRIAANESTLSYRGKIFPSDLSFESNQLVIYVTISFLIASILCGLIALGLRKKRASNPYHMYENSYSELRLLTENEL